MVEKRSCSLPAGGVMATVAWMVAGAACSTEIMPPGDGAGDGGGSGGAGGGSEVVVSFAADIQPVLTTACAGCHSPGGIADLSGIPTHLREGESYDMIVNVSSVQRPDLVLVVPGDAEASLLFQKVSSDSPPVGERMPLFAPVLAGEEIELIREWIDQGAADN